MSKNKKVALPKKEQEKPDLKFFDKLGIEANIPIQNLKQKSLFIATPMYGGLCHGTFSQSLIGLIQICKDLGITVYVHTLYNESLIQRGRNYCADTFLNARIGHPPPPVLDENNKPKLDEKNKPILQFEDNRPYFSHLLFIDSDISFNPQDVIFMLGISEIGSDKDVICGPYPKKCISWEKIKAAVDKGAADIDPNNLERYVGDFVFNPVNQGENGQISLTQPIEILEGGTGFMLIQRQAFEKFRNAYPEQSYRPDHVRTKDFDGSREIFAYFDCPIDRGYTIGDLIKIVDELASENEIDLNTIRANAKELKQKESKASKRYLSEDYMFCQYLKKAGGKIWLIPWVKLQHTGTYVFGGSLIDLALIGQSATADPTKLGGKK